MSLCLKKKNKKEPLDKIQWLKYLLNTTHNYEL